MTAIVAIMQDRKPLTKRLVEGYLKGVDASLIINNLIFQGEKRQIYDENIQVPLIVRGPGIQPGSETMSAAVNVDLVCIKNYITIKILLLAFSYRPQHF